ncbi:MAG: ABC-F family ATPase, partial [Byssovorax sp.]
FVSHDRWFVSELATRILEVTPTGPRDFPGTYTEYLARCGDDHLDADAVVLKEKKAKREEPAAKVDAASGGSWEDQKRKRNRAKDLPARRDKVLADVEVCEARKKAIHDRYCVAGFYETTPKAEITALEAEEAALGPKIDALLAEWEALESEIAAMG